MKAHNLIECWGSRHEDFSCTTYVDRIMAEVDFEKCIEVFYEGSDQDTAGIIQKAVERGYVFKHSDGFIALETVDVRGAQ